MYYGLKVIETATKEEFEEAVSRFLNSHKYIELKFQRNLYYSLSGSTHKGKEQFKESSTLKEGYVAFILYEKNPSEYANDLC